MSIAADAYHERVRRGEQPDIDAFCADYPGCEDVLRRVLPALGAIGSLSDDALDLAEPSARAPLGDFAIRREIGRGGMGVVYEAEQLSLARRVALKVLPFAAMLDPRRLQRFKNEAQAAGHLHHNNIVPVHAVGCERGVHYYAMQYIEGLSVAEVIDNLRVRDGHEKHDADGEREIASSPALKAVTSGDGKRGAEFCRTVARLGVQAAEALDHAHTRGIIHRDIKPGNLLVDATGNLWITDFGLASCRDRDTRSLTMSGDLIGTLRYMSPEQAMASRAPVDHRTDTYSLGATLYEFLTLEPAMAGTDTQQVLQNIAFKDATPARQLNPDIPEDLETILIKAMAKDAADRFTTAQELADDLRRFLEYRPIRAKRPSVLQRASKWAGRHKRTVAAAVVVLLMAVLGLAIGNALIQSAYESEAAARQRAQQNLDRARRAVDELLTEVAQTELVDVPQMHGVRRRLLTKAIAFYEDFLAESGDDPIVRHATARAYTRAADILETLGDLDQAEASVSAALALTHELRTEFPGVASYLVDDVAARRRLADILHAASRPDEALIAFRQAVDDARRLVDAHPHEASHWRQFAASHRSLGVQLWRERRNDEAEAELSSALSTLERLVADHPDRPQFANDLVIALGGLARVLVSTERLEEAEGVFVRAIAVATVLVDRSPEVAEYRRALAATYTGFGQLLHLGGKWRRLRGENRHEEAWQAYSRSREIAEVLVADFPSVPKYVKLAADANRLVGHMRELLGDFEGGLAAYERGIRIAPSNATLYCELAWVRANSRDESLRDLPKAIALAEQAVRLGPRHPDNRRLLAAVLYRAGEWERVVEVVEGALPMRIPATSGTGHPALYTGDNPHNWLLLAMAKWQLGDRDRARDWYAKAVEWMKDYRGGFLGLIQVRREADALMGTPDTVLRPPRRKRK